MRFKINRILWFIAALSFLLACPVFAQKAPPKQPKDKSEDEIVAAVIRYATLSEKGIVFLEVNGRDPSPETLRLLSVLYVRVLPSSRMSYVPVPNQVGILKDKKTGELGSLFVVEVGKRLNDAHAEVEAGWWQACGGYAVAFQNGSWFVESYKARSICF
jgi:hypothetical protein